MSKGIKQTNATKSIGMRVKTARKKIPLKTFEFAKLFDVSAATASNWEAGRTSFTADHLLKLAYYLRVSPAWLLTGEGEMEIKKEPTHEEKTAIDD